MSELQKKKKMNTKDAIFTGALGAVCIIIRFAMMIVGGISPYVWFSAHFIDAILIGPVFMLMVARTQKNGPFVITSVVTGLIMMAATWMLPVTGLIGGLLSELCLRKGKFQKTGWLIAGFFCFNLGFIGDYLPLWLTKDSYLSSAAVQAMDAGYVSILESLLTLPVFVVIVISIIAGSVIGGLAGIKMMKKHFSKAGLIK